MNKLLFATFNFNIQFSLAYKCTDKPGGCREENLKFSGSEPFIFNKYLQTLRKGRFCARLYARLHCFGLSLPMVLWYRFGQIFRKLTLFIQFYLILRTYFYNFKDLLGLDRLIQLHPLRHPMRNLRKSITCIEEILP